METLTELVAKISTDATELKKGLSDAEKGTEQSSKRMADSLKKIGMAMAASGAAIVAAMGFMGKAAIDEEINIKNLAAALKGVGVNYDDVKDSLEAVIAATQRKTGIADNEQRDILNKLLLVTKDYDKALNLLPLTLDLAAAGQMDAKTAAVYLSKAYEELEQGADKIGIRMGTTTVYFKDLTEVEQLVGGRAAELANPLDVLKASMGDVAEAIGKNLVPIIKDLVGKIVDIAEKVQAWAEEHPGLAKVLTITVTALGLILGAIGSAILIIPKLVGMWTAFHTAVNIANIKMAISATVTKAVTIAQWLWNAAMTANPIGLLIVAIGALIAAGLWLWKNWDKVVAFFKKAWANIKIFFLEGIESVLGSLSKFTGWIPGLGKKIDELHDKISGMIEAEKVKKDLLDVQEALADTTEIITEHTEATDIDTEALTANTSP